MFYANVVNGFQFHINVKGWIKDAKIVMFLLVQQPYIIHVDVRPDPIINKKKAWLGLFLKSSTSDV